MRPPHVRRLLERCLRKDPKLRLRDIGEARIALDEPPVAVAPVSLPSTRRAILPWAVASLFAVLFAAAGAVAWFRPGVSGGRHRSVRASLARRHYDTDRPPAIRGCLAGRKDSRAGRVRSRRPPRAVGASYRNLIGPPVDGTDGASNPFWSPDSQYIGFFADDMLKKIPAAGGSPQGLCNATGSAVGLGDGATWNSSGVMVFWTGADSPLMRVLAAGGPSTAVTKLDTAAGENRHSSPQFLPDGRHLLYFAETGTSPRARFMCRSWARRIGSSSCAIAFAQSGLLPAI